jgi:outer membrane receptor for ferric coprogen and ferric-rhodotorulic acid
MNFSSPLNRGRRQQAKMWELRTSTSMARLWQRQDKRQDAYDLLAPVEGSEGAAGRAGVMMHGRCNAASLSCLDKAVAERTRPDAKSAN